MAQKKDIRADEKTLTEEVAQDSETVAAATDQGKPDTGEGAVEASAEDNVASLRCVIAEQTAELEAAREQILRMQADFENAKKRLKRDTERTLKFAVESFAKQLLETKDNLERALATVDKDGETGAGLALTLKNLEAIFKDRQIEEIAPQGATGEAFNPELHEAVGAQNSDEHEPNTILALVQKGYRIHERLLRPARVIVVTATVATSVNDETGDEAKGE